MLRSCKITKNREVNMTLSFPYIFLLAVSLAMDAFAVSISAGISMQKKDLKEALKIGRAHV